MRGAERRRDVIEIGHRAHVDPGLRHRDHDIGLAEAKLVDQHHACVGIRDHLADLVLAGDAEMHRAKAKLRRDVGGRQIRNLDARQA
jgi:hypothetical protein